MVEISKYTKFHLLQEFEAFKFLIPVLKKNYFRHTMIVLLTIHIVFKFETKFQDFY